MVPFLAFGTLYQAPKFLTTLPMVADTCSTHKRFWTSSPLCDAAFVASWLQVTVPWSRQNCRCDKGQQMWIVACTQGLSKSNSKQGTVICPILVLHVNVAKGKLWTPASKHSSNLPFEGAAEGCWQAVKYFNDVWWAQDV